MNSSNSFLSLISFKGRATRSEFWPWVISVVALFFVFALTLDSYPVLAVIIGVIWLLSVIPYFACVVRRLHDISLPGWVAILLFVPYGQILLLVLLIAGSNGNNKYGPSPKGDVPQSEDINL